MVWCHQASDFQKANMRVRKSKESVPGSEWNTMIGQSTFRGHVSAGRQVTLRNLLLTLVVPIYPPNGL